MNNQLVSKKRKNYPKMKFPIRKKQNLFYQKVGKSYFQERKYTADEITDANVTSATGAITLFGNMLTGTTNQTRIGNKVVIEGISVSWQAASGATTVPMTGAFSIIYDNQPDGVLPAVGDSGNSSTIYNGPKPIDNTFINNQNRYTVLWSHCFKLVNQENNTPYYIIDRDIGKAYIKCNLPVLYNTSSGSGISAFSKGALYFVARCSNSTTGYSLLADVKVKFRDSQ